MFLHAWLSARHPCAIVEADRKALYLQGRAAPITINVYFHIVQVRLPSADLVDDSLVRTGLTCINGTPSLSMLC